MRRFVRQWSHLNAPSWYLLRDPTLTRSASNSPKTFSIESTLVDITTQAKGGFLTKPLKLGTDLTITCA
jgi:hypothetical protein